MGLKQFFVAWRAFKRLVYLALIWTCVCYVVFRFTQKDGTTTILGAPVHRALLQKLPAEALGSQLASDPTKAASGQQKTNVVTTSQASVDLQRMLMDKSPHVDNYPSATIKEFLSSLSNISNIPSAYWTNGMKPFINAKSCVKYPNLYDLSFNNLYWQKLQTSNGTFYVYGAYFDNRPRNGGVPLVRLLVMVDRIKPPPTICQLWYDDAQFPTISSTKYTYAWYSKWGNYKDGLLQPFIVTCKAPYQGKSRKPPASVSLVEKQCDAPTTNLRIVNNRPTKKEDFAVCVKGLDFLNEDLSVRLVEWIELLNILGAKKIFLYELEVHPNISKVLNYYQKRGLVEITPITLPGGQPNLPGLRHHFLKLKLTHKRQNELIPYNDCLYRNIYSYQYLALLDIDEVIMPMEFYTWKELIDNVVPLALNEKNYTRASYNVRNVYFLDDMLTGEAQNHEVHEKGIPNYMHMLQHVYRSKNFTKPGSYVKCFHNIERIVSLHNHFPLNCYGSCTTYSIEPKYAQLQHYRKDCVGTLKNSCKNDFRVYTVRDTTIWKYKDELVKRATFVLNYLGYFS